MKISEHPVRIFGSGLRAGRPTACSRSSQSGFTVLVVMVLLVIMASLAVGNNVALGHLQAELRLVERRQQDELRSLPALQLYRHLTAGSTNTAATAPALTGPGTTGNTSPGTNTSGNR